MKLLGFLAPEAVIDDLQARDKSGAIKEMVAMLKKTGLLKTKQVPAVVKALLAREKLGSTGIGKGVAVPHARCKGVKSVLGLLARSTQGVQFDALDGEPVYVFFLLLSAPDASGEHLACLERVSLLLRDTNFCRFLKEAEDKKEVVELLKEAEENLKAAEKF
ncbi:MAG: PTS fructose transporter subunit IIA [Planctomycetes bacterium DG_23]|nr:MAG: PTS fructose transporter subunit IIA [Planctomycetes bacterium DG_23]